MKKLLVILLLAFCLEHAPFRLLALVAESFVVSPGPLQTTSSEDGYWQTVSLEARLTSLAWTVHYRPDLESNGVGLFGVTIPSRHAVFIDADLHWSNRFAILAHEAGHTLQPAWVDEGQGECFAESVATLIAHDGLREHARYLSRMKWTCVGVVAAEWPAIYHAAAVLEDR